MIRYYLVRHGETEWNRDGNRYCGRTNLPLTPAGHLQAEKLANFLQNKPIDLVLVSPLQRARDTARPIIQRMGLDMHIDERLREIDFGVWEGLTQREIEQRFPKQWADWIQNPGKVKAGRNGESAADVFTRMKGIFSENRYDQKRNILLVSHNTAIRLFLVGTFGMPFVDYRKIVIDNAGVVVLNITSSGDIEWQSGGYMAL